MQARQLQHRDEDLEETVSHLQLIRLERKERYNEKYEIRATELAAQDVVLLHDTRREKNISQSWPFNG